MLIQEADVGLRTQWDVVLISSGLAAAVLLFLFRSSLASSLQQLLELRFHQCPSEPSPTQVGIGPGGLRQDPGFWERVLCSEAQSCPTPQMTLPVPRLPGDHAPAY